jgi:hypothetical protein
VERTRSALVVRAGNAEGVLLKSDLDRAGNSVAQLALGTLDADDGAVQLDLNAGGNGDGETSNT